MAKCPEFEFQPRLVRLSIGPEGEKIAEYESLSQTVERLANAAVIATQARCPEEAARLAKAAAQLAEVIVAAPAFVES